MSAQLDGGPAFPQPSTKVKNAMGDEVTLLGDPGMSLRDWFAGQVMAGMLASGEFSETDGETLAVGAYMRADEMLRARNPCHLACHAKMDP